MQVLVFQAAPRVAEENGFLSMAYAANPCRKSGLL